jgi:acyl-CoA thioester hydrolase
MLNPNEYSDCRLRLPIRPNDFDYAAYLNNAVYVEYLEAGRVAWAELNRIDLLHANLAPAVSRLEIDYVKGIVRGKDLAEVEILTTLVEMKPVRMLFHQSVSNQAGIVCARAVAHLVMVDLSTNQAVPLRSALERMKQP